MKTALPHLRLHGLLLLTLFAAPPPALPAPGDAEPWFTEGGATLYNAVTQPDGRIVVGSFQPAIFRLNREGTYDLAFHSPSLTGGYGALVRTTFVQNDGKMVVGGSFTVAGNTQNGVARLLSDGTLDAAFQPRFGFVAPLTSLSIDCTVPQADGKILVGGIFNVVAGTTRNYLARLNADGTLDTAFNPNPNQYVFAIAVQGDGKILIGGQFNTVGGVARPRIARLNANGTLDTTFIPYSTGIVFSLAVQGDGKILVGTDTGVYRLKTDGGLDIPAFVPQSVNAFVYSIALQTDGKAVIGGNFTTVGNSLRNRIARLNVNGSVDAAFNPNAEVSLYNPTPGVRSVTLQDDGKVLVAGDFQNMGGNPHAALARLENNPATQSLTQTSENRFQWLRGGASPEAQEVTFEISTDGDLTWTPLGSGTRIAGGWEVNTRDHLPTGHVRARARIPCGDHNGSSGLVETTMAFNRAIAEWKLATLGYAYAPDAGDPDGDGLPTLAEYALNLSPATPNPPPLVRLPIPPECGGQRIFFTRDPARNAVTIEVQAADSPAGPWSTIATSAQGGVFTGTAHIGGDSADSGPKTVEIADPVDVTASARRFLRVKVTH